MYGGQCRSLRPPSERSEKSVCNVQRRTRSVLGLPVESEEGLRKRQTFPECRSRTLKISKIGLDQMIPSSRNIYHGRGPSKRHCGPRPHASTILHRPKPYPLPTLIFRFASPVSSSEPYSTIVCKLNTSECPNPLRTDVFRLSADSVVEIESSEV